MPKTASRYYVTLGERGEAEPVDVTQTSERELQVTWREQTWTVDALALAGGSVSLVTGHRSYSLELDGTGDDLRVAVGERQERVRVADERSHRMSATAGRQALEGRQTLSAPMPGKVVRVLVNPGDEVAEGQGLVVVEAMKMENELRAPRSGRVEEVAVSPGQTVESGARLVVVS
ncbi:MAG TPA: biotin/lipoyl-containing protein [Myxococcales bacterium]|jgi:biotin carboxyl carrier protein